jgi:MFS family permease
MSNRAPTLRSHDPVARPGGAVYPWYVLGLLTTLATLSAIDRQVLALVVGPLQRDLGVSDTMIGLLGGFAFTLFYTLLSLPMASIADRRSRRGIMAFGIFAWSVSTIACGLANSYGTLFLARMFVGIGEAVLVPAAVSLLGDYFDRPRLPLVVGIFFSSTMVGIGLAYALGGVVVASLDHWGAIDWPLLGTLKGWQSLFVIAGLPGFAGLLLMATVKEPERFGGDAHARPIPFGEAARFAARRGGFLFWHFLAYTALATQGYGLFYWAIEFLVRDHGFARADAGKVFGTIVVVAGIAGSVICGIVANRMVQKGGPAASMRLVVISAAVLLPVAVAMPLMPSTALALALTAVAMFMMSWPSGPGVSALQFIVPPALRGRVVALYLVVVNFLSYTLGPLIAGALTDLLGHGSVGHTLSLMAAIDYPLALVCLWRAMPHFRRALAMVDDAGEPVTIPPSPEAEPVPA